MAHPDILLANIHEEEISMADRGTYSQSTYYFTSTDFCDRCLRTINLKMKEDGRRGLDFSHLNFVKNKKVINLGKSHII